ncbi:Phosphoglycerate kinase [Candidatus Lokiarchaeum ossiferum]|uniref:Phosphoglycerate kinase n=1 Tax=Candidatus Lokiarchaeum ossiferum TaxID=2951803 RepID=A0ABY6HXD5_9ARCH|nr:Phosphoglycerate kinase [Candidatus Lokiarchaeum sp. B-35]
MTDIQFKNITDFDIKGKKILVRVDINSSIDLEKNEIRSDPRIQAILPTLESLKEAAVVLIAHQSRLGKPDCIDLKLHADKLNGYLGGRVKFVADLFGDTAISAIKELQPGEVLLLNNVRKWEIETQVKSIEEAEKTELITKLSPLFDYFVNDAFGAAHRAHVSLIGWPTICAGPTVKRELEMVQKLFTPKKPSIWLVGGAKAMDKFQALKFNLEAGNIDMALVCGLTAILMLEAKGMDMGEKNRKFIAEDLEQNRNEIAAVCEKFKDKIFLPEDMAYEENGKRLECPTLEVSKLDVSTGDIGAKTIANFKTLIQSAKTIVANGPPGIFEKEVFKQSSFEIVDAMAAAAKNDAFVCIGGGDMGAVAEMAGLGEKITISTGGGALLKILSGKDLPLLQVLRNKMPK